MHLNSRVTIGDQTKFCATAYTKESTDSMGEEQKLKRNTHILKE
jgi:hypothetical protein